MMLAWMNRFPMNRIVRYSRRFATRSRKCLSGIRRITLDNYSLAQGDGLAANGPIV